VPQSIRQGDRERRFDRGLEQKAVDRGLVLIRISAMAADSVNTAWKWGIGLMLGKRLARRRALGQCQLRRLL